ncbi:MAG: PleD family two-component system response regulator [Vulcanimicrobiota bacterium]
MKKVLIAEGDEIFRRVIDVVFMNEELEIIFAKNGSQAMEIALSETPDVVVTELKLPEMNGIELMERLKSEEVTSGIPVIVMSSNDDDSHYHMSMSSGAQAYLVKPFSPMRFLAHLDMALKEHEES